MNFVSGEELLTVKDIAREISFDRSDDGIARTMRQIRHWTQNDLLRTASVKNTGKGVPRLYEPEPTIQIAAILLELSRYGVTVEILKPVAEELWDADEAMMYIDSALTHLNSYLQVSWTADPLTGAFTGAEVHMFDEMDLDNVDTSLDEQPKFNPIHTEPSSSILVNMSNVMTRIYASSAG